MDNKESPIEEQRDDTTITGNHVNNLTKTNSINSGIRDEEVAAELTEPAIENSKQMNPNREERTNAISSYGWIALALSVLSFFIMPILLGAAGIVLGFVARTRNAVLLGNTAIIIGATSIIIRLFIIPFVV